MDIAYDHIQEEVLSPEEAAKQEGEKEKQGNLNAEFQEAYKSFSASPWGARLGGFFSDVKKQSETYYEGARQEASAVSGEAIKGFTDLRSTIVNRARSMSTGQSPPATPTANQAPRGESSTDPTAQERSGSEALRESEGIIARFRTEASKRLKDIEKAEDAADEALLKFGTNIRNFLQDAVTIAPPTEDKNKDGTSKVLFESKDQDGKRVIHTTRFDAQLHAIHSSLDSFSKDPVSPRYEMWKSEFDVEKRTDAITTDLEKYEELRRSMEKLVPEKVEYPEFWTRYYFLRMVVESEEQRRREMLKGKLSPSKAPSIPPPHTTNQPPTGAALTPDEPISWDDDSDTDSQPSTPHPPTNPPLTSTSHSSSATILPQPQPQTTASNINPSTQLKPTDAQGRRSQDEKSQADSDASYDLVSGATSRAPGSPKENKVEDEEDEPDWE